jgi:hypothetical protein
VKQTTFEEFVELARRGTFVPVVKEIIADLLTPVSAFLKIAEHSDYARIPCSSCASAPAARPSTDRA